MEVQRAAHRLHPDKGCGGLPARRYDLLPDRSRRAGPSYRPERPFVIEGTPSKIEMMCRSSFMNTKDIFRRPHDWLITWAENGFRQDSTISTTLPSCCVNGCIRRI